MIDQVRWIHIEWLWPVLGVSTLLLVIFLIKELKSTARHRPLRVGVAFIGVCTLALIALKPTVPLHGQRHYAVVLTRGYAEATLDSLKRLYNARVIYYEPGGDIFASGRLYDSIFLLGDGLAPYDLWQLDNRSAVYLQGAEPSGVVKLKYPHEVTVGAELTVEGVFRNDSGKKWLLLEASEGYSEDSVLVEGQEEVFFSLKANTKATGRFLYHMAVKDTLGNALLRDPLPVTVKGQVPLNILIINAFPTFETKYLKNFLAEEGHAMIVRSQVSRGKYRYEYFNRTSASGNLLSSGRLKTFDLVIADHPSMTRLSLSELRSMEEAVNKEGVGLFIQPDEALFSASAAPLLSMDFIRDGREATLIEGQSLKKHPVNIVDDFLLQPVLESEGSVLASWQRHGRGKVGTMVLNDTYVLLLKGKETLYRQLWTSIIDAHARTTQSANEWHSKFPVAFPHEPYEFQLRSREALPQLFNDNTAVPVGQDIDIPELWYGRTWPRATGWSQLSTVADSTYRFNYYVADTGYWVGMLAERTRNTNRQHFQQVSAVVPESTGWRAVNLLGFYFLFILCVGYLWLVPKL
ncbi:Hypothetical protein C900_01438 [Fulvivirga imtechensis AK7]|uniref:Uncharacterized protein n=1 Tax=Fulvivirga imtechensis AK7 TaxID=1237149 RepID=L8K0B3_9BACT|nr:hypothetical protein [Fulvivirga imtechensis]ELR73828.1 Hypothetical protein C900_01438 [Fulvivirga imtechensis AK7]